MMKPTKAQAKVYIQEALDEIPDLMRRHYDTPEFAKWRRNTRITISNIFGNDSGHAQELDNISFYGGYEYQFGMDRASGMLESMIDEIDRWWPEDNQASPAVEMSNDPISNRVFVVHGRDEAAKQTVARYLEGMGLEPVILQEQPSEGRTIIEKFEEYAGTVGFAVILGTPDDVGGLADKPDNQRPRMRQNVIFELGYFTHALGRKRVCVLLKGDVERPSDYDGVIYIPLDDFGGWQMELAKEMRSAGLPVDMNRLLST